MNFILYAVPFFFVLIALELLADAGGGEQLSGRGRFLHGSQLRRGVHYLGIGVALENRPWALQMELLRLASNLPLVWLAPLVGLWPASALGWVGLSATACSVA
ncbi:hypothetical protein SAMN05660489_01138 [Pseudomonas sp. LAMO17WK12:I10]|nr:hypothetical protein H160_01055 [Pseudomonas sp. LAMO17WK12:I9]SNY18047.1 hypothetical protein SAMN05660489_01138 [Pseudomonas sp. LAMO17WK12:I10]